MNNLGSSGGQEANMRGFLPMEIDFGLGLELPFAQGTRPDNENLLLDAVDDAQLDDVVIISPRKFEAKNNAVRRYSLRSHGTTYSELTAENHSGPVSNNNHGGTPDQPIVIVDCELSLMVGDSRKKVKTDDSDVPPPAEPPPSNHPPPKAPKFTCAICMCEMTEATSTKCGHIFCKACLAAAIATYHRCPTCRRKLRKNDMFRVYLPEAVM